LKSWTRRRCRASPGCQKYQAGAVDVSVECVEPPAMGKKEAEERRKPISDTELTAALEASGFPLELKLFHQFAAAGMDPVLGHRLRVREPVEGKPSSHEVDLMARVDASLPGIEYSPHAAAIALIDAKKLHDPARFVGIVGEAPTLIERRVMRSFFFGCPSFRVTTGRQEAYGHLFIGDGGFSESLDLLTGGPVCAHWTIVKREKDEDGGYPARTNGDGKEQNRYYQAMHTLVSMAVWNERESSEHSAGLRPDTRPLPQIMVYCPTLIVDTPSLCMYDPKTGQLEQVDRLMIRMMYDVDNAVHSRIVDVVSTGGVAAMIERYKATGDLMRLGLARQGGALNAIAREIRQQRYAVGRATIVARGD
jgi:hypothetical protein